MAAPDGDIGLQLVLDQPGVHDDGPSQMMILGPSSLCHFQ